MIAFFAEKQQENNSHFASEWQHGSDSQAQAAAIPICVLIADALICSLELLSSI
jgi:hypothetical protein